VYKDAKQHLSVGLHGVGVGGGVEVSNSNKVVKVDTAYNEMWGEMDVATKIATRQQTKKKRV